MAIDNMLSPHIHDAVLNPTDLLEDTLERFLLRLTVDPPVVRIGEKLLRVLFAVADNSVAPLTRSQQRFSRQISPGKSS